MSSANVTNLLLWSFSHTYKSQGVLILADTLAAEDIPATVDPRFNMTDRRLFSARAIVNIINLTSQIDLHNNISSSILLRDPYPEHISNGLSRTAYSILCLYNLKVLLLETAEIMASVIFSALEILTQVSYSAADSLSVLQSLYIDAKLNFKSGPSASTSRLVLSPTALTSSPITSETFKDEVVQELGQQAITDPSLVNKTIEQYEVQDISPDLMLDDLPWVDFSQVGQGWTFEVSDNSVPDYLKCNLSRTLPLGMFFKRMTTLDNELASWFKETRTLCQY
jgi:hypothetical protein